MADEVDQAQHQEAIYLHNSLVASRERSARYEAGLKQAIDSYCSQCDGVHGRKRQSCSEYSECLQDIERSRR